VGTGKKTRNEGASREARFKKERRWGGWRRGSLAGIDRRNADFALMSAPAGSGRRASRIRESSPSVPRSRKRRRTRACI
jgi:hypothetical protein